jgi:translocation and assembly module TamA
VSAHSAKPWLQHRALATWLVFVCGWLLPLAAGATIKIEIQDVPQQMEDNIRAFLSLTRYAERTDITQDTMGRLLRRVVPETRAALEPLGYYEPKVDYGTERKGDDWTVIIFVEPGRPVRISETTIDIVGPGRDEPTLRGILAADELKPGLRLNHGTYETVKGSLLRAAKNQGYIDAAFSKNELLIDKAERRATIALVLQTGERYRYGTITTIQDVIEEDAMRRLLRMKTGDPYTLDSLLRTQYVLDDSQYFASVDIDSGEPDTVSHTVPVTVNAQPNRKQRYAASFGYATDTKARGKITWDNRLVNRSGHRAKMELTASSVLQELSMRYAIPVRDIALEKLEFTGAAREEELGDTLSQRFEFGTGLTQVRGSWQRSLFVRLSNETTTLPATDTMPKSRNTQFLIIPGISLATIPSYVVGDKLRPYSLYTELRGSPSSFGSDSSFLQLRVQAEGMFNLSPLWSLRLRSELGTSWVGDFSELPASQRFFAGGDRSVRGFALNSLSPKDDEGNSIGGQNLLTGTVEIERALPRNFGVAAFYDIGNAFDHFGDRLESAAGLGLRYHIAVASLGVDVAQPLSVSGNPRLHLYISTLF